MLCSACSNIWQGKQTRWMGSHKATIKHYLRHLTKDELPELDRTRPLTSGWATENGFRSDWEDALDTASEVSARENMGRKSWRGEYIHHPTGRDLIAAASEGCQVCTMFLAQVSETDRSALAQQPQDILPSANPLDYPTTYRTKVTSTSRNDEPLATIPWILWGHCIIPAQVGPRRVIEYSICFGDPERQGLYPCG